MSEWLTGIGSGVVSALGQWSANRANLKEAARNRAFQERMSNTAVQRRMEDMRKAGVNPILAARFDASTPAGAMANLENVGAAGTQGFSSGAASALAIRRQKQELRNMEATALNTEADTRSKEQQRLYVIAQTNLANLNAEIREPLAWAASAAVGAIPAEIRNNPEKTKEYLLNELKKFVDSNPELVGQSAAMGRLVWSAVKNLVTVLATSVNETFGPGPDMSAYDNKPGKVRGAPGAKTKPGEKGWKYESWQQARKAGYKGSYKEYVERNKL